MKYIIGATLTAIVMMSGCSRESEVQCTTAAKDSWQNEQLFKDGLIAKGYVINEFKVTPGNCYEIYGTNPEQTKVEIYFNPVDGTVVKEERK